jgi:hypothetical protein
MSGLLGAFRYNYVPAIRPEFRISDSGFQCRAIADDSHFQALAIQANHGKLRRTVSVNVNAVVHARFTIRQLFMICVVVRTIVFPVRVFSSSAKITGGLPVNLITLY